jgi:small subunit ribosomal protein S17
MMADEAAATTAADAGTAARHNGRKVREGVVTSTSMDKTAIVTVTERVRHRLYRKTLQRSKKLYAHDEENTCRVGDRVRVAETRPLSKLKRWRLLEVVERAK